MAESFLCAGEWVHLSNGATESLFEGWERLARSNSSRPGMVAVAAYLRRSLEGEGAGCRAFGMDREYLPEGLSGPAEIAALLAVAEQTAADPTLIPDIPWSPDLSAWWRDRLSLMVLALRTALAGREFPTEG